jgi:hypothetical protein
MPPLVELPLTYLVVCAVTAFVCTAVKEDEDAHLWRNTARLFGVMAGGIAAFAVIVQAVTLLAD